MDVSVDSLRKYARGIQWCDEAGVLTFTNPVACVIESAPAETEARNAVIQARDLRREINEAYRAEARSEALRRSIIEAAAQLPPMPIRKSPWPRGMKSRAGSKLVVPIADCHYGGEWEVRGLKGELINKYSPEIFEMRMGQLLEAVVAKAEANNLSDIIVLMAGDSLDGMLRQSQLMRLRYGIVDSTMRFAEYMAQWVDELTTYGLRVEVYNVLGNHSEIRPLGSKRGDFPEENLERIITWYMAERLSGNELAYICPKCEKHHLINIAGSNVILSHGDDDNDIAKFARDMILQYQMPVHYFYTGHKHKSDYHIGGSTADGSTDIIRIPSICGVDIYANSLRFGGRAGTKLAVFEDGVGITAEYPIWLNRSVAEIE